MANLREVALKAGVSTATVSRVINNHPSISFAARQAVHKAMDELCYLPLKSSIKLSGKKTGLIGCVVPNLTNPHFSELVMCLEREARYYGRDLLIRTHLNQAYLEKAALESFIAIGVEGLFWVPTEQEADLSDLVRRSGIETVVVTQRSCFFNYVMVDYRAGMRMAAEHLHERGWSSIGFIGQENVDVEKYSVFREALAGYGLQLDPAQVHWLPKGIGEIVESSGEGTDLLSGKMEAIAAGLNAQRRAKTGIATGSAPAKGTAFWVYNDVTAVRLYQELQRYGFTPGKDVGIISFDNTYLAQLFQISSFSQPIVDIACYAYSHVAQPQEPDSIDGLEIRPVLHSRHTT